MTSRPTMSSSLHQGELMHLIMQKIMLFDHARRTDFVMEPHSPERHVQAGMVSPGLHAQPGATGYTKANVGISSCK